MTDLPVSVTATNADGVSVGASAVITVATATGVPLVDHVVVVLEENRDYADIIGWAPAQYLNDLIAQYGLATQYYANTHPSIGNYMMLTAGAIITNDDAFAGTVPNDHIIKHIVAAGKTWKVYAETLPSVGYIGGDTGQDAGGFGGYIKHHNPFAYFADIRASVPLRNRIVPFSQFATDLAAGTLPNYAFVIPNNNNNMHDDSRAIGSAWVQNNVGPFLTNPAFQSGMLIVVWDESDTNKTPSDNTNGGGRVPCIICSPKSKPGYQSTTLYQHQSVLRLCCDALGIAAPGAGATAPSMAEFFANDPPPPPPPGNLIQSPSDLTAAAWTHPATSVTATKITENNANAFHNVSQTLNAATATTLVFNTSVKPLGRSFGINIQTPDGSAGAAATWLLDGSMQAFQNYNQAGFGFSNISISPLVNGSYPISTRLTVPAGAWVLQLYVIDSQNAPASYLGNGLSGVDLTAPPTLSPLVAQPAATFFVSAAGSDANDGLSQTTPWKTIDKINAQIFSPGTKVFFRGGDTFTGGLRPTIANGDPNNRCIFDSYGTGMARIIPSTLNVAPFEIAAASGVIIQNLWIDAPDPNIQGPSNILITNDSGIKLRGVTIRRNKVTGNRFGSCPGSNGGFGAQIGCQPYPGSGGIDDIVILNNDCHGVDINARDDAGILIGKWGGQPVTNVRMSGNHVYYCGTPGEKISANPWGGHTSYPPNGNGLHFMGVTGGLAQYNIVHDMSAFYNAENAGPVCLSHNQANACVSRFNEGYNMNNFQATAGAIASTDHTGVDFDTNTSNCVVEYNYMHDNNNCGFVFFCLGELDWDNNTFRKNISGNNCRAGNEALAEIAALVGGVVTANVSGNIIFNNRTYTGDPHAGWQQCATALSKAGPDGDVKAASDWTGNTIIVGAQNTRPNQQANTLFVSTYTGVTNFSAPVKNNHFYLTAPGWSIWYNGVQYTDPVAWEAATGKGPNTWTVGGAPNPFALTANLFGLSAAERALCVTALQAVSLPVGTSDSGLSLPGTRAASLITRLQAGDTPINLDEFVVLGFALTRAETPAADALLARIEPIVQAS